LTIGFFILYKQNDQRLPYQLSFLRIDPVDTVQAGFAFAIGKNSKTRARRTEPRIRFKERIDECTPSGAPERIRLRFGSTIPNFLRQFPDSKSEARLDGIDLSMVSQRAKG